MALCTDLVVHKIISVQNSITFSPLSILFEWINLITTLMISQQAQCFNIMCISNTQTSKILTFWVIRRQKCREKENLKQISPLRPSAALSYFPWLVFFSNNSTNVAKVGIGSHSQDHVWLPCFGGFSVSLALFVSLHRRRKAMVLMPFH